LINQFVVADNSITQYALIDEILYQWATTSDMVQTVEARLDGLGYNFEQTNVPQGDIAWDHKLHVIEAFNGRYLVTLPTTPPTTSNNWFASGENSIDVIQAGSSTLEESQLAQLLQSMALVGTPAGINGQWTEEQQDTLAPILST
jgi:hypothetical protein